MLGTELVNTLTLTPNGEGQFLGHSMDYPNGAIFGGQLLAQAIYAAAQSVSQDRAVNAIHAQFLTFGDPKAALDFFVRETRDGRSTCHRQVEIRQEDRVLMVASIGFQALSGGFEFQEPAPVVPAPDALFVQEGDLFGPTGDSEVFPFDARLCPAGDSDTNNVSDIWVRCTLESCETPLWQQMLFAFVSDSTIMHSALLPHELDFDQEGLFVATMNHTLWFHRPCDPRQWMLMHSRGMSTGGGRALSFANAYSESGILFASASQEAIFQQR